MDKLLKISWLEYDDDPNRQKCQSRRSANELVKCTVRARGNFSDVHSKHSLLICVSEKLGVKTQS